MEDIYSKFDRAEKVLVEFSKKSDKYITRYCSLRDMMNDFIKELGLTGKVVVNNIVLGYALVDYFEDIMRLKDFHKVEHINNIKIVAYTSYWLLQAKPLQLLESDKGISYLNEKFVLSYIITALESRDRGRILERNERGLSAFSESLLYFLKYRGINAQSIEMAIIAFCAGRVYQETDQDISSEMGKLNIQSLD